MSKTIKQSLEDLVISLGGDPAALSDNTDTSDVIDDLNGAIKNAVESVIDDTEASETKTFSSSKINSLIPADELPAVTDTDNGKVLTVVNGAWGAAAASGGNDFFVITATNESDTIILDKTYSEIESAYSAGKIIIANYGNALNIPVNYVVLSNNHPALHFVFVELSTHTTIYDFKIDCENEIAALGTKSLG